MKTATRRSIAQQSTPISVNVKQKSIPKKAKPVISVPRDCGTHLANPENIFEAIKIGNVDTVEKSINEGASVNNKYPGGKEPLWYAVRNGNIKIVNLLLSRGANPNLANRDCNRSTHELTDFALEQNNTEVLRSLLENGADLHGGNSPSWAEVAIMRDNLPLLELLEKYEQAYATGSAGSGGIADSWGNGFGLVRLAVEQGNHKILKYLLESAGAAPGFVHPDAQEGDADEQPIIAAIERRDLKALKLLLDNDANPNIVTSNPASSPLHEVYNHKETYFPEAIAPLVKAGADLNLDTKLEDHEWPESVPIAHYCLDKDGIKFLKAAFATGATITQASLERCVDVCLKKENYTTLRFLVSAKSEIKDYAQKLVSEKYGNPGLRNILKLKV